MLELKHISKEFDQHRILDDIQITFPDVGLIGIQGQSGCGKSTLLSIVSGLQKEYDGEVLYNGKNIRGDDNYRKNYVSYMMQNRDDLLALTVYENIVLPAKIAGIDVSRKDVIKLANTLEINEYLFSFPDQLSGGQRQRVSIAKAIMKQSPVLICDEPTGALHQKQAHEVMKLLKDVSKERLVIVVSHDLSLISAYCDTLITMKDGRVTGETFESSKEFPLLKRKKRSLWFYPLRQMLYQKNKLSFLCIFQWIIIVSSFLILTAIQGVFTTLKDSETQVIHKNMITLQNTDTKPFTKLIEDPLFQNVQYDYHFDSLIFTHNQKEYEPLCSVMPDFTKHISLQYGRLPRALDEILVSHSFYQKIKSNQLNVEIGDEKKILKVVGILNPILFEGDECYISKDFMKSYQDYQDPYTLLIEAKDNKAREVYQKYTKDYIVYSDIIERVDNYHSLLSLSKVIAYIFIGVSFIVSLILIMIVESIIYFERQHDYAYLIALGIEKKRLFVLTLFEALVLVGIIVLGGMLLSYMSYVYVNDVYHLEKVLMFRLMVPTLGGSPYAMIILFMFVYAFIVTLGVIKPYMSIKEQDIVEILREE